MKDGFEIVTDVSQNLIVLRLDGFWTQKTVQEFKQAMHKAIDIVRSPGSDFFLCLTDARSFPVQSKEVVNLLEDFLKQPGIAAARSALVTHSALSRLQGSRIEQASDYRAFDNELTALAWLAEALPVARATVGASPRRQVTG